MKHPLISAAISDLSPDANILFVSASVTEILGWDPQEVQGRSCFDYFHPDEEPWARRVHGRGVKLDKAASLHYLRVQHRNGQWVSCECCFTVVHDVLVACTSIYRIGAKSESKLSPYSFVDAYGAYYIHREGYRCTPDPTHLLEFAEGSSLPHVGASLSQVQDAPGRTRAEGRSHSQPIHQTLVHHVCDRCRCTDSWAEP